VPSTTHRCPHCGLGHPAEAVYCPGTGLRIDELPPDGCTAIQPMPKVGALIGGKYRIDAKLGSGSMGEVYRATHTKFDFPVAIKVLNQQIADEKMYKRFLREGRIASQIKHGNVVELLDVGAVSSGLPYLVMELLDGESLAARLEREVRLPLEEAIEITLQVLKGLEVAHAKGVVHRDVKPDNLFLHHDGHDLVTKILDFGISKAEETSFELTGAGQIIGTPHYLAPEQVMGALDLDRRVDLWATGIVCYEMITGRVPYDGDTIMDLMASIAEEDAEPPSAYRQGLPVPIDTVMMIALQREPEYRFQSAAEFREALGGAWLDAIHEWDVEADAPSVLPPSRETGILDETIDE